jgi:hypothetical protein
MRGGSIFLQHFTKKNWNYQKKYLSLQHRNDEYVDISNISKNLKLIRNYEKIITTDADDSGIHYGFSRRCDAPTGLGKSQGIYAES